VALGVVVGSVLSLLPGAGAAGPALAPLDALPAEVRKSPVEVRDAYRYAVAHPEILKAIPCYCGCEVVRHRSNYDCYVAEVRPDGSVVFSDHGLA